ncbi:hypothetical protein BH20ACT13_BH20ACT13_13350 [soil metagenome]
MNVVFPAPFEPSRPVMPGPMSASRPASATVRPYRFTTPRAEITAGAGGPVDGARLQPDPIVWLNAIGILKPWSG